MFCCEMITFNLDTFLYLRAFFLYLPSGLCFSRFVYDPLLLSPYCQHWSCCYCCCSHRGAHTSTQTHYRYSLVKGGAKKLIGCRCLGRAQWLNKKRHQSQMGFSVWIQRVWWRSRGERRKGRPEAEFSVFFSLHTEAGMRLNLLQALPRAFGSLLPRAFTRH